MSWQRLTRRASQAFFKLAGVSNVSLLFCTDNPGLSLNGDKFVHSEDLMERAMTMRGTFLPFVRPQTLLGLAGSLLLLEASGGELG